EERPDSITPEVLGAVLQQIADLIRGAGSDAELDEITDQIAALGVTDTELLDKINQEITDRKASIKEVVNRRAHNKFSFSAINALSVDSTESSVKSALKTANFVVLNPMKFPDDYVADSIKQPAVGDVLYNATTMMDNDFPYAIITEATSKPNNWFSFSYEYAGKKKTIKISEAYKVLSVTELVIVDELNKKVESEGYDSVVGDLEANLLTDALRKTPQVLSESEQQTARANIGAQGQLTTSADLALRDDVLSLTEMAKKRLFIDLWNNAAGSRGRYNEETGYFELCEIYDIDWDEALLIFKHSYGMGLKDMDYLFDIWTTGYGNKYPRVLLPLKQGFSSSSYVADVCLKNDFLERIAFTRGGVDERTCVFNVQTYGFMLSKVEKIYDIVQISQIPANNSNIFNMPKLVYGRFKLWGSNHTTIYFRAPLLDYASTSFLFTGISTQNANGQCVFKLAANMYNRLNGTATDYETSGGTKEEWMALADLATSKNITLATE
ncbi:MAG: hypothetical protein ACI4T0_06220, partial [Candidatus Limisoma sp.]